MGGRSTNQDLGVHSMKVSRLILPAAAAVLVSGGLAAPAQGATAHCSKTDFPNKVEVSGDRKTVQTGLEPGTAVCIKAGTKVTFVTVDANGNITQSAIKNKNGKPLGISYYAYGKEYEPPCEDVNEDGVCDEDQEYCEIYPDEAECEPSLS